MTGRRSKMGVNLSPDVVVDSVHDFFGPLCLFHALAIGTLGKHLRF